MGYYDRLLAVQPNHAEAHSNLGTLLCRMGQMQAAIAHQQQAVALKTKSTRDALQSGRHLESGWSGRGRYCPLSAGAHARPKLQRGTQQPGDGTL